jgi:hypothetical protein
MSLVLGQLTRFFTPASPLERGLIAQAVQAEADRDECVRVRATLRADVLRTADRYFVEMEEDNVEHYRRMLDSDPATAVRALKRSAAGCRCLIGRWEHLERALADDGTWYGADRIEAIQIQGLSARVDDHYLSESAYMTWLHCLAAQPNPKERDIALVLDRRVMPKSIQDRDLAVWPGDPAASRAALAALVARALPELRRREEWLRVDYEQPVRAEAKEQALARLAYNPKEVALLRAQRSAEQAYQRASRALLQVRARLMAAGLRPARPVVWEAKLINGPAPNPVPPWPDGGAASPETWAGPPPDCGPSA